MDIRKLQRLVVDALEDVKAQDIKVYNSTGLTQLFDRVIIASGTSNRQTKALAASVRDKVKAAGGDIVSVEGENTGEWVLVDLGDAVVHVMQPAIRAYYNLEEIWGAKPVSLKSQTESDGLGPRVVVAKKSAAPAAARSAANAAAKSAAEKAPSRKTTAKKTTAPKMAGAKTVGAPRAVARKTAAPKSPARKGARAA